MNFPGNTTKIALTEKILYAKFTHVFLSSSDTGG